MDVVASLDVVTTGSVEELLIGSSRVVDVSDMEVEIIRLDVVASALVDSVVGSLDVISISVVLVVGSTSDVAFVDSADVIVRCGSVVVLLDSIDVVV